MSFIFLQKINKKRQHKMLPFFKIIRNNYRSNTALKLTLLPITGILGNALYC